MNRLLELKLQYRLNEILSTSKKQNAAYILFENETYYFAMLFDRSKYKSEQLKFSLVKKINADKYVLKVSSLTLNLQSCSILNHIKNEYAEFFDMLSCLEVSIGSCSRKEFELHFDAFYKKKQKLHSKNVVFDVQNKISNKHISSYETDKDDILKHLVKPRNEKERKMAIVEREIFHNPKMWTYLI